MTDSKPRKLAAQGPSQVRHFKQAYRIAAALSGEDSLLYA